MKEATPQTDVVEEVERTAHYPITRIVTTMRISAMMLEIADADGDNPKRNEFNRVQADFLRAAARAASDVEQVMRTMLASFVEDPPDTDFQKGYLVALIIFATEGLGFHQDDPLLAKLRGIISHD